MPEEAPSSNTEPSNVPSNKEVSNSPKDEDSSNGDHAEDGSHRARADFVFSEDSPHPLEKFPGKRTGEGATQVSRGNDGQDEDDGDITNIPLEDTTIDSGATNTHESLPRGTTISPHVCTQEQATAHTEPAPQEPLALGKGETREVKPAVTGEVSEHSHQQLAPHEEEKKLDKDDDLEWQEMPKVAEKHDLYDDEGKIYAHAAERDEEEAIPTKPGIGGKGYTRVEVDEDAKSATSMDDQTAYLFKEPGTGVDMEDEEARDPMAQMQATKDLLDDNQKIAYVGVTRLAMADMVKDAEAIERSKVAKKQIDLATEAMQMWSQKIILRLYARMELEAAEQLMIENLVAHSLQASDLTPTLMKNARVKNPMSDTKDVEASREDPKENRKDNDDADVSSLVTRSDDGVDPLPPYEVDENFKSESVHLPSDLPQTQSLDIDLRWTVLCDLFLTLIADSTYDARSRVLLERVGSSLDLSWLDICRFEKRVTEALEMQAAQEKETWDAEEHLANRAKLARRKRLMMVGLATAGGGLVLGVSMGALAPVIGAGLAAGFTAIGVSGTSGALAGGGTMALIGTTGVGIGGAIGGKAMGRRSGSVKTFEFRPLHNNNRVNLTITVSGWLIGGEDDVRLPFSTINPIMGDIFSIHWEPDMLRSMGQTIGILASEALTQAIQQILGSTLLTSLMAALYLPVVLSKLSYLIDNPWSVSCARADRAGLILADSLIDRNLGCRPVTLVGYSIGARVIFSALQELAKKGAVGIIQNAYLFGSPVIAKKDEYLRARAIVAGRFVNGYATNDWILGYLFRATSGGIMRVAGLAQVDVPGIENIEVTSIVAGHMAYRKAMPKLMKHVDWIIDSEDFAEIEDPDPDNHEARQRQLINEIEEARKEIQEKPEKKGRFGFLRGKDKSKLAEKKPWELYSAQSQGSQAHSKDDKVKDPPPPYPGGTNGRYDTYDDIDEISQQESEKAKDEDDHGSEPRGSVDERRGSLLFDIDAIRAEAASIAASGLEIKELESTLPPLKIESPRIQSEGGNEVASLERPAATTGSTQSFDASNSILPTGPDEARSGSLEKTRSHDLGVGDTKHGEEDIEMTFEQPPEPPRLQPDNNVKSSAPSNGNDIGHALDTKTLALEEEDFSGEKEVSMTFE